MPLLITPRLMEHRSDLYHQIGSMVSAGLRLREAVETLAKNPPARSFRKPLERLVDHLNQGDTFTAAMAATGGWMPAFDLALLEAGEKSGRLDQCLQLLSNYYRQQAMLVKNVIGSVAWPFLTLHVAVLVFPTSLLVNMVLHGAGLRFVLAKLAFFLPLYGGILLFIYACQGGRHESWRLGVERFLRLIPGLGSSLRKVALSRLAAALDALMAAGVSIYEAWEMAAAASGSPEIKRTVVAWRPEVESGVTPSEAVRASGVFPDMFVSLYHSAEISGQQEEALTRMHKYYYEEGLAGLKMVSTWAPRLFYLGIVLYAAVQIVNFYSGYFNAINAF